MINNLTANNNTGKLDRLTRLLDLSNMDYAKLTFDVAYARYDATRSDKLRVYAVTCDGVETLIYDKTGTALATVADQTTAFTPTACNQWRTETLNLNAFVGKTIKLVFEDVGGWGNRLYLDNIKVQETDAGYPLAAKVYLQGHFNTTTNLMDDYFRTGNLLPNTEPFTGNPNFTHIGGGGEVIAPLVLSGASTNNAISDWLFLELRSKTNPATVVATRSALLQRDGDIVDMDGKSAISFKIPSNDYYFAVKHRNHLGFRTFNTINLSNLTPSLNFTNNSIATKGATPFSLLSQNIYAMNSGDSNSDGSIDAFDTVLWELQNGLFDDYQNNADYNLDGSVDAFDTILWELNNGKFEELD
jgi:hypothetical protein